MGKDGVIGGSRYAVKNLLPLYTIDILSLRTGKIYAFLMSVILARDPRVSFGLFVSRGRDIIRIIFNILRRNLKKTLLATTFGQILYSITSLATIIGR